MRPEERDKAYLWDMLDAAKAIRSFIDVISYEQYIRDRKVQMACERALEIIGRQRARFLTKRKPSSQQFLGDPSSHSETSLHMSTERSSRTGSGK
jgi:uncharacterized protein with HEPN domain